MSSAFHLAYSFFGISSIYTIPASFHWSLKKPLRIQNMYIYFQLPFPITKIYLSERKLPEISIFIFSCMILNINISTFLNCWSMRTIILLSQTWFLQCADINPYTSQMIVCAGICVCVYNGNRIGINMLFHDCNNFSIIFSNNLYSLSLRNSSITINPNEIFNDHGTYFYHTVCKVIWNLSLLLEIAWLIQLSWEHEVNSMSISYCVEFSSKSYRIYDFQDLDMID